MKQQEVFNKIGGIIKELNDQYKYLESNPEDLNELELELFVANAHFLADHAEVLFKLNTKSNIAKAVAKKDEDTKEKYFEPVIQQQQPEPKHEENERIYESVIDEPAPHIDLSTGTPEDSYSYIREEPETIRHELVIDEAESLTWEDDDEPQAIEEKEPITPEEIEEPIAETKPNTPFKAEEKPVPAITPQKDTAEEVLTINQRISAQLDKSNKPEHITGQPISDLKQAINLNDKLLYVKDLFNGYSLAYSEAIDILNRFNTFDEADKYLKTNYSTKNNWGSKQETTDKFYALLHRRYA